MRDLNKSELAEVFDVTIVTVDSWIRKGCPYEEAGKNGKSWRFSLKKVVAWRVTELTKDATSDGDDKPIGTAAGALTRKTLAEAELKELELAELKGEIIRVEDVMLANDRMISDCKKRLLSIPTKLAPLVISCKTIPQVKELIEGQIHEALNELSNIDPAQYVNAAEHQALESAAEVNSEPVGRPKTKAQPGGKRRAGAVVDGPS